MRFLGLALLLMFGVALAHLFIPLAALQQWPVYISLRMPGGQFSLRYVLERAAAGIGVVAGQILRNFFSRDEPAAEVARVVAPAVEAVELGEGIGIPVPVVGETQFLDLLPREAYVPDTYEGDYASADAAAEAAASALSARIYEDVNYVSDGAELVQRLFISFFGFNRPEESETAYVEWPPLDVNVGLLLFDLAAASDDLVWVGRFPPSEQGWAYGSWFLLLVGNVPVRGYAVPYGRRYSGWAYVEQVAVPIVVFTTVSGHVGVDYCRGWWYSTVVGVYAAWYSASELTDRGRRYVLTSISPYAGAYRFSGVFPHSSGVYGSVTLGRLAPHYEMALQESMFTGRLLRDAWARTCGFSMGVQAQPLPWDVEAAPDTGVAVRQRDGAAVWWIARPLEWLRSLFVPSVPLTVRFERLQALISERVPFSVATALRNYVPPVGDGGVDAPCFSVGHGRQLCPDRQVLGVVAAGSRWGAMFVLGLGVVVWLQRRLVPSLRL